MNTPDRVSESIDCVHPALGVEIHAVAGHYAFIHEVRLPFGDEEVLYFVGAALMDSACCGTGGCGYAVIQGIIERYHYREDETGRPVSIVRPIDDPETRQRLDVLIKKKEFVQQVVFA